MLQNAGQAAEFQLWTYRHVCGIGVALCIQSVVIVKFAMLNVRRDSLGYLACRSSSDVCSSTGTSLFF